MKYVSKNITIKEPLSLHLYPHPISILAVPRRALGFKEYCLKNTKLINYEDPV